MDPKLCEPQVFTQSQEDFLSAYRSYVANTIVPRLYQEWAAISAVASVLAQQTWIERGYYKVYPNLYIMLIGDPAAGKGTTCAILRDVLQHAGYKKFAPDRSTKEKFLMDLEDGFDIDSSDLEQRGDTNTDEFFKVPMFRTATTGYGGPEHTSDVLIHAEELSDFFGSDNLDFIALLTKLWSHVGPYDQKIKTGRSVRIPNPCINMFTATTHDSFQLTFPSRLLGTGFLARFILVYGALSDTAEVAFPRSPVLAGKIRLGSQLSPIQSSVVGQMEIPDGTRVVFEKVLQHYKGPDDARFKHYRGRRLVQCMKLAIVFAASRGSKTVTREDVIGANTLLYATEQDMGKALGEFGKSRNSEVSNKIMQVLYSATEPVNAVKLFKMVSADLVKMSELHDVIGNLTMAEKIRYINTGTAKTSGYLPFIKPQGIQAAFPGESQELLNLKYLDFLMG